MSLARAINFPLRCRFLLSVFGNLALFIFARAFLAYPEPNFVFDCRKRRPALFEALVDRCAAVKDQATTMQQAGYFGRELEGHFKKKKKNKTDRFVNNIPIHPFSTGPV